MKRNLKNSIVFILIAAILLLVVAGSLAASKPVGKIKEKDVAVSIDPGMNTASVQSLKWSGLGMGLFSTSDASTFDGYVDTLLASGFTELRVDIPNYQDANWLARSKAAVVRAVAKGANVIWGVSSYNKSNPDYTITTENWPAFRQAILDNARWAQDNGVYEFQLGNEEDMHIWRHPVSITRTNNIATVTFRENHGFTAGNPVIIWGADPDNFDVDSSNPVTIVVTGPKTFNYPSAGSDVAVSNPSGTFIGNISEAAIEANIKAVATDVQAIFTRGNVSYSTSDSYFMDKWHTLGLGDIDLLAWNIYANMDNWQTSVNNMISWWGPEHSYITEFNLNYNSLNDYSVDETVQAEGLASMIDYIYSSGVTRANYFVYKAEGFGALKGDGTYRLLWNNVIANVASAQI